MSRLASFIYLPPPDAYPSALAILENLRRFPPAHDLIVYSDYAHDWPGLIRLKVSPEVVLSHDGIAKGDPKRGQGDHRISNCVFLTGLQIMLAAGYTHVIPLEADCRVGRSGWDVEMFDEFFKLPQPCIAAGSLGFYNPASYSPLALKRWQEIVVRNTARNFPCPTYGWVGSTTKHPTCVFPNGALSVLDLSWMQKFFTLTSVVKEAVNIPPWDMQIGVKIWDLFKEDAYDKVGQMHTIFSGNGDIITTEESRMAWLRSGKISAVHQVKSSDQP